MLYEDGEVYTFLVLKTEGKKEKKKEKKKKKKKKKERKRKTNTSGIYCCCCFSFKSIENIPQRKEGNIQNPAR